jgi:hypothetical protein
VEYVETVRLYVVDMITNTRTPVEGTITCPANGLLASYNHVVTIK